MLGWSGLRTPRGLLSLQGNERACALLGGQALGGLGTEAPKALCRDLLGVTERSESG